MSVDRLASLRSALHHQATVVLKYGFRVLFYYVDLVKDIILLLQLRLVIATSQGGLMAGGFYHSFPAAAAAAVLASILASWLTNAVVLLSSPVMEGYSRLRKGLSALFIPVVPAAVHYKEMRLEMEANGAVKAAEEDVKEVMGSEPLGREFILLSVLGFLLNLPTTTTLQRPLPTLSLQLVNFLSPSAH